MAYLQWSDKDPQDISDYELDWSAKIGSDTVASSTWEVSPSGSLTIAAQNIVERRSRVRLSGGTTGTVYTLLNRIGTGAGQQYEQQILLRVVEPPTYALTVEDGTGVDSADSYATELEIQDWLRNHPSAAWTDESLEALAKESGAKTPFDLVRGAARVATKLLDMTFGPYFRGQKASASFLRREWPRVNAYDAEGNVITGIPHLLKEAQFMLMASYLEDDFFTYFGRPIRGELAGPAGLQVVNDRRPAAEAVRWAGALLNPLLRPLRLQRVS